MKKKISIIIPIFSLEKERLTNFLFICKELGTIKNKVEIFVAEQLSTTSESKLVEYLKIYPHINHIKIQIGDVFNKSILINRAFENTNTKFLWILDSDFYTNYEFVIKNINSETEFLRPFSETIELTQSETNTLLQTKYAKIERDSYTSSSANGKYSFILKSEIFEKSGMMDENFKGWGFQDLDFIENRLSVCKMDNLNILGMHLYHPPASRKFVNENKSIYLGIQKPDQNQTTHANEPTHIGVESNINHTINHDDLIKSEVSNQFSINNNSQTEIYTHIHVSYNNFLQKTKLNENVKIINPNIKKETKRDNVGRLSVSYNSRNFLYFYVKFICDNYINFKKCVMFSNDYFLKNHSICDSKMRNLIISYINKPTVQNIDFKWLGEFKKPKLSNRNGVLYNKFVKEYLKYIKIGRLDFNPNGNFIVSETAVRKNPFEFYENILRDMPDWTPQDYEFLLISLKSIFT